jgi:hypothetical protein
MSGCTDPLSTNYNPAATVNNGSCTYASASVSPLASVTLPEEVEETSGLFRWGNYLYTHNDNTDVNFYALDSITGQIMQTIPLTGASNIDWEDATQDESYIYVGDFGNNSNGNRTNLRIIRFDKAQLQAGNPQPQYINFSYSNQSSFTPAGGNNTDFDCEAVIASQDSLYLFTKQWNAKKTSVYRLPKTPGTYVAQLKDTYNVNGLITGAAYLEDKRLVVLTGYSSTVQPFLYLLYDFEGHNFFSGNKRKLNVSLSFHQTEGIATTNGTDYFVTNEKLSQFIINTPQKLHRFNLGPYLQGYLDRLPVLGTPEQDMQTGIRIYPNPAGDILYIDCDVSLIGTRYYFIDMTGKMPLQGVLRNVHNELDISSIADGLYSIRVGENGTYAFKLVKKK